MANIKISGLTVYASPLYTDILPIVDLTSGITKRVTLTALLLAGNYVKVVSANGANPKGADYPCTGSADQTNINLAITAVNSFGKGAVYLRGGNFSTTNAIVMKSLVKLIGESRWTTKIANTGSIGAPIINASGTSSGAPVTDIEIAHLKLDGTSMNNGGTYATGVKGIYITYIKRSSFHDLYIYNTYATGLGIDFSGDCEIHHNLCDSCGRGITDPTTQEGGSGIGIGTGGFTDEPTIISNNICKNNGKYGIFLEGQSSTAGNYAIVSHNICYGNYHGLGARSNVGIIFDHNHGYSNTKQGLDLSDSPFSTLHNTDIKIQGNMFKNNGGYGLKIANTHTNTLVEGNSFSGNTTAPMSISASTTCIIRNNPGYNPVGVSSISVGSSPFTYTAGNSPETVYITGGTVSLIVKNSVTLFTATERSVNLEPNEAVVITYSSLPTMNKDIH